MSGTSIALLGFAIMLLLIAVRMPIGLSMFIVGAFGYVHFTSFEVFMNYIKTTPYHLYSNYTLSVIPLFVLMGALAEQSGLSRNLFQAAGAIFGHIRGGLSYSLIAACTLFGAICGSSVATTATFARACLPEFKRNGYDDGHAAGTISVGGTLGILIPPSVILVVYAISTEQNIAKLFNAAIIPGLMACVFYWITIYIITRLNPSIAPALPKPSRRERLKVLGRAWPVLGLAIIVVGGINGGVFTPTQGAAVGVILMLIIGLAQRLLGWEEIKTALIQTAEVTGMIFFILLGADTFNAFLALTQLPTAAAGWVVGLGLSPYLVVLMLMFFYVILGAVMDELAMILLTLPIFFPIVMGLDFGFPADDVAIWFGILVLIVVGIGLTAPPIGLNVIITSAIAKDVPIEKIYKGVLPFLIADFVRLGLIILFPGICLWLVRIMV
jgi:C4-dicarboxylate transporter, DctM subunit